MSGACSAVSFSTKGMRRRTEFMFQVASLMDGIVWALLGCVVCLYGSGAAHMRGDFYVGFPFSRKWRCGGLAALHCSAECALVYASFSHHALAFLLHFCFAGVVGLVDGCGDEVF